jgi:hypothetical protein
MLSLKLNVRVDKICNKFFTKGNTATAATTTTITTTTTTTTTTTDAGVVNIKLSV